MSPRSYTNIHDAGPVSADFRAHDGHQWLAIKGDGFEITLFPRSALVAAQFRAVAAAIAALNAPPVVALPPTDADGLDVLDAFERAA